MAYWVKQASGAVESLNIENFFVVADQNQQITEENSSHDELKDVLGLDSSDVIELKENWRM
jgi:acyl carrier protein